MSPPFCVGLGGGARGALVVTPSLLSSLSGCLIDGTCFSDDEVSTKYNDTRDGDSDREYELPSLVSLGSLGSFGLSVGDVSTFNATMTTVCAVAETAMRQQCAGEARMLTDGECGEQQ